MPATGNCGCSRGPVFRHVADLLPDDRQRRGIEFIEQLAAGVIMPDAGRKVISEVRHALPVSNYPSGPADDPHYVALMLYRELVSSDVGVHAVAAAGGRADYTAEQAWQSSLLRDIFGNPFRPITFNPAWRTSEIMTLAHAIYDERGFDRVPMLADALENGSCDNAEILAHCRTQGPHVRGCWVVDAVLGKA